jgi:hypothetical protein
VNPIKWRVASRTYCHEVIIIRNSLWCGCCTCRHREWEETRGWLGLDPTRSRAHRVRNEERVGPTPHHTTCRFAHARTAICVHLPELYLFCACFTCREREWEDECGREAFSQRAFAKNSNEFTVSTEKKLSRSDMQLSRLGA